MGGKGSGRPKGSLDKSPRSSYSSSSSSLRRSLGRGYSLESLFPLPVVPRPLVLVGFISVGRGSWGHMRHLMNNVSWDRIVLFSDERGMLVFGEDVPVDWFLYKRWGTDKRTAFFSSVLSSYLGGTFCVSLVSGSGIDHLSLMGAFQSLGVRDYRFAFLRRGRAVHVDFSVSSERYTGGRSFSFDFVGGSSPSPVQPVGRVPPGSGGSVLTFRESLERIPRFDKVGSDKGLFDN